MNDQNSRVYMNEYTVGKINPDTNSTYFALRNP